MEGPPFDPVGKIRIEGDNISQTVLVCRGSQLDSGNFPAIFDCQEQKERAGNISVPTRFLAYFQRLFLAVIEVANIVSTFLLINIGPILI